MNKQHWLLILGWLIFGLLHSLLASVPIKKYAQKTLGYYYVHYRKGYSILSFLLFITLLYYQFSIKTILLFPETLFENLLGLPFCLGGLWIMLICVKDYAGYITGPRDLTAAREDRKELLLQGLHRYTRHPLYFGTLCLSWGIVMLFPLLSNLVAAGMLTCYTLAGIYFEEKKLVKQFGSRYVLYQKETSKLIPFPKKRKSQRIPFSASYQQ